VKVRALYWWIDRWRKSTAYTDMSLEQQGAYRNLLDEAALRGGALPLDDKAIAKASGDATRWPKLKKTIMQRFVKRRDGYHNETLDSVLQVTANRSEKQRRYRETHGGFSFGNPQPPPNAKRNGGRNSGRVSGSGSGSGSKDQDLRAPDRSDYLKD
jgi:hypothetical protein